MNESEILRTTEAMSGRLDWDDLIKETRERIKALRSSLKCWEEGKRSGKPFPVEFPKPTPEECFRFIET